MRTQQRVMVFVVLVVSLFSAPCSVAHAQVQGTILRRVGAFILAEAGSHVIGRMLETKPSARIQGVRVIHNQASPTGPGMLIYVDFLVNKRRGNVCNLNVYFYFQNGPRLRDYNGYYAAPDGQVAVGWQFVPGYDPAQYNRVELFIPYSELHLVQGHHDLVFDLQVQDPHNQLLLAQSRGHTFHVDW